MPTLYKMSEDKKTDDTPTVVFAETPAEAPRRKTKKFVIIAVSGILAAAIILTAILVGMYIFTKAQMDIVQYTMQLGDRSKQDVTSDPNENVVQFHVSSPGHDAWIVNDFNKDIQLVKVVSEGRTNCYVSPLNRTNAMDPSKITGPGTTTDATDSVSVVYRVSDTPVTDTSFLGKTATATCKGISIYWLYPTCAKDDLNKFTNGTTGDHPKQKRQTTINNPPYYCSKPLVFQSPYNRQYYYVNCVTGCCKTICACNINYYYSRNSAGQILCSWVTSACPPTFPYDPVAVDSLCYGPAGLSCPGANHNCYCP